MDAAVSQLARAGAPISGSARRGREFETRRFGDRRSAGTRMIASPDNATSFTPQQHAAIAGRGNLLVVAGAGTGKTRTLVARCLRLVADERVSLENILMVTFTEAAA